jgi:predicted GIY-YIG superfamily endonuclease
MWEHKNKVTSGFAARYRLDSLVHFETFANIEAAIAREKQLKGWLRSKKIALIDVTNPNWTDLAATHFNKLHAPTQFPVQPAQHQNRLAPTRTNKTTCHPERSEGSQK